MNIIAKKVILFYVEKYPPAKAALLVWLAEITRADFQNFRALKRGFVVMQVLEEPIGYPICQR